MALNPDIDGACLNLQTEECPAQLCYERVCSHSTAVLEPYCLCMQMHLLCPGLNQVVRHSTHIWQQSTW
jgi:hypothetical protein